MDIAMRLTSKITTHNPEWSTRFKDEADRIRPVIGSALCGVHHVGSTAVAGLSAKPEIDILIIVDRLEETSAWTGRLFNLGYLRGKNLSPGHLFYKRNVDGVRTHKLHICIEGHGKILEMLTFRDALRSDASLRTSYEKLKLKLEAENSNGIGEYLEGKAPFIRSALDRINAGAT